MINVLYTLKGQPGTNDSAVMVQVEKATAFQALEVRVDGELLIRFPFTLTDDHYVRWERHDDETQDEEA